MDWCWQHAGIVTGDFAAFFEEVRRAAKRYGIVAHVVSAVAFDGPGGQVKVSSHANHTFDEKKDALFIKRCIDSMEESTDSALYQLAGEDAPSAELKN